MISFQNIFKTSQLTRYVEKMSPGNSSGGKLELIGLSSLFKIKIIIFFHFLAQEKHQLVVENNYSDKQATLLKNKEQYDLLIHKTEKVKYLIYKRSQIVEIDKESKYCESPIQENDFVQEKSTTLAYKFYEDVFIYLKDGTYPNKLIQSFTDKTVLKSRKIALESSLKRIEDTS